MGLKLEGSDFDRPGFFKRGEVSASLKLVGKVAWENDRFARQEMRRANNNNNNNNTQLVTRHMSMKTYYQI